MHIGRDILSYTHETHASRSCPLVVGADISYQNTFLLLAGKISVNISDEIDCNTFLVSDSVTDSVIYNLLNRYAFFLQNKGKADFVTYVSL